MKISKQGIDLLKHFDSYEMKAYTCPAGVWTLGWGFTQVNGVKVKEGDMMPWSLFVTTLEDQVLEGPT
ncbi:MULTISPECIES: hypothetical protein [Psychrilyobacter]|uniref:Lysozyme n=1 Tax=Psychrilyobacter piezotolerans TaxID=2293438 RepID=A0ABX9KFD0_9FUSO|nr:MULTISPECIES: hypothetical protein [Psychrilyobacter]MCS5422164.1 hypothetical protein [Psychrilyobacter sp. S5]NDI78513.1 lysozyme [Psychrilyobacter piezotolerans]RDE60476.1 hypothetical protein DV867_10850 [Psychrilyobacter sp. S5]REI40506.1 hypothetical protein DYH56_10850 [Psychrilyobacter piezotolerans]